MTKKDCYRKYVKELREKLSEDEKNKKDISIYNKVIQSKEYKDANSIFIYVSYKNEVDTHNIIKRALSEGKCICVPKIISLQEGMKIIRITGFHELRVSKYGILEPDIVEDKIINAKDIDVVYTPGVAFDLRGGRIGYGGGFYDRFLSNVRKSTPKLALAYSFQIFDEVPMDKYDVFIDGVITE